MTVQLHLHRSLNAISEKHPKASAQCLCHSERFFSFSWGIWCSPSYPFTSSRLGTGSSRRHNSTMTSFTTICCIMHVDLRCCKLLFFLYFIFKVLDHSWANVGTNAQSQFKLLCYQHTLVTWKKMKQQHQKVQSIARTATTVSVISSTSAVASKFPKLQDLSPVTV